MAKVTCGMAVTTDGLVAGLDGSFEKPFGNFPKHLVERWIFDESDRNKREKEALTDAGAFIMGMNMFCPPEKQNDPNWRGWWGDNPPYHAPVFILTHTKREPIRMSGGTTFYFFTDGIDSALQRAKDAAGDKNVAIAGGAHTVNEFLRAGYIDELWLHILPVTVGEGLRLFSNVPNLELKPIEVSGNEHVTHIRYEVFHR